MFGYVKTDFPNLYVKDTILYKAMYCGLCKSIGYSCGQRARLVLNYDLTFLSVLLHNLMDLDIKVENQHCVIHRIKKRPIAVVDELSKRIGALNVILAHYKLSDDIIDNKKGKFKRSFFNKAYKKAKSKEPAFDLIVKKRYNELLSYEKNECSSIDIIADPFGKMLEEIVSEIMLEKANDNVKILSYNLGKWIYLIDALDDFDKDKKENNYNVFINEYKDIKNKDELIKKYGHDIITIFASILSKIAEIAQILDYRFNHDLIDNILLRGLSLQTKQIMENKKCKNTTKF